MPETNSMVLNLDLATAEVHSDEVIRAQLDEADRDAPMIRATMYGAPTSPTGSHSDWSGAGDAVFRMAHALRAAGRASGETRRVVITGRAGLPLFVQLGAEVTGRVLDFSLLNRRQATADWDRLDFAPAREGETTGEPFFAVKDFRMGPAPSGRVAVTVSTTAPRATDAVRTFFEEKKEPLAGELEIRAVRGGPGAKAVKYLDRSNAASAAAELIELFNEITVRFPDAKALAVFVDGPATLAFLVGRAIVLRRSFRDVWVPSFHDGAYHDAIQLPHRPNVDVFVIHDPKDSRFRKRLDTTLVGARAQFWDPSLVGPGEPMSAVTRRKLDAAEVVVVLVTADLLANASARELIARAIARQATSTRVVPILVRECDWTKAIPELGALQALPTGGRWLKNAKNDRLWTEVDVALRRIIEEVRAELFGEEA